MPEKQQARRDIGLWRGVAAAWAVALLVFVAFAAVQAVASLRATPADPGPLAGVVIPHHSQLCADGQCRDGRSRFTHLDAENYNFW